MLVCRDAGLGGLLLATAAATPPPKPPEPAQSPIVETSQATAGPAAWTGPWGGFPMPLGPLTGSGDPGPGNPGPTTETPTPVPPPAGSPVPEPSSLALFLLGLAAAPLLRRRSGRRPARAA